MINTILGEKTSQSQKFLEDGTRIPVTEVVTGDNIVISVKTKDKHGYCSVQLGFGLKNKTNKAMLGYVRGANLKNAPLFLREVVLADKESISPEELPKPGENVKASEVFKPGDIIDVIGVSKGKGFAGVVKRHHFKGGPRTRGQSDRERAPGSIGQTTTPGRVYKGKRMAGKMGRGRTTVRNLKIVDITDKSILIDGLVPGGKHSWLMIRKVGEDKKFVPLYKAIEEPKETTSNPSTSSPQSNSGQAGQGAANAKGTQETKEVKEGK